MLADISLLLRVLLSAVFLSASASKIVDVGRFERALKAYPLLGRWSPIIARVVPVAELVIGFGLATGMWYRETGLASVAFLGIATLAITGLSHSPQSRESCGCGGLVPEGLPPRLHIAVNAVLVAFALVISMSSETVGGVSVGAPLGGHVSAPSEYSGLAVLSELVVGATAVTAFAVGRVKVMQTYQMTIEKDA